MQNAGIAALWLDWRYTAAEVRPEQLREAIAGAQGWFSNELAMP